MLDIKETILDVSGFVFIWVPTIIETHYIIQIASSLIGLFFIIRANIKKKRK